MLAHGRGRVSPARRYDRPVLLLPPNDIDRAAALLRTGELVGLPTETVYGLAADATNEAAVRAIFAAKGRPLGHPVIVHLADVEELPRWSPQPDDDALRLAVAFWPGPLTLVVRRGPGIADAVTGGRDTVGLRVPDHAVARAVIRAAGVPVAAPSANRFGRVSPTTAADVVAELGDRVAAVIDGGPCRVGVESTIVEVLGDRPVLLRPGGVPVEVIEEVLGGPVERVAVGPSRASGMLASHYAPATAVTLVDATAIGPRVAAARATGRRVGVLAPAGSVGAALPGDVVVLDPPDDLAAYAATLYRRLRDADDRGVEELFVVPPPPDGLGLAVLDRLRKAAAPRSA
ncbi:MAG: threonylcarbamoyl-AMP synthase [Actinobacteria bacterium]|nr:threonylcarbamoyl-AMP synthase [Actinomycetota bacterium]